MDLKDCISSPPTTRSAFSARRTVPRRGCERSSCGSPTQRGFYFMTMSPKAFSGQLHADPNVEVCFYNGATELPEAKQMRVTGAVEFLNDPDLTHKVAQERAALEGIIGRPLEPITEVFRIAHGEAHFWTLMDILKESELERVRF